MICQRLDTSSDSVPVLLLQSVNSSSICCRVNAIRLMTDFMSLGNSIAPALIYGAADLTVEVLELFLHFSLAPLVLQTNTLTQTWLGFPAPLHALTE